VDLRKYEYEPKSDDDYRHRMLVNMLATIVVFVLMVTEGWLVDRIISSWPW
jgi:F0F1-type ATP synthase assembly protein I